MAIIWVTRYVGYYVRQRVRRTDLMLEFCKLANKKGYTNFLYGAINGVLHKLTNRLAVDISGLKMVGAYSPPFRPLSKNENGKIIQMINNFSRDVVWVSLGCRKQ